MPTRIFDSEPLTRLVKAKVALALTHQKYTNSTISQVQPLIRFLAWVQNLLVFIMWPNPKSSRTLPVKQLLQSASL